MIEGNMKRRVSYLIYALLLASSAMQLQAQDLAHYKRVVKEISSAKYQGRGYAKGGANKAGRFLQKEYQKAGVDEVILQPFTIDINTFCGKMEMWADGKKCRQVWISPCVSIHPVFMVNFLSIM